MIPLMIAKEFANRSLCVLGIVAVVLLLAGLPRARWRYRILTAAIAVLSFGSALDFFSDYLLSWFYLRSQSHWVLCAAAVLLLVCTILLTFECIALRVFRRCGGHRTTG